MRLSGKGWPPPTAPVPFCSWAQRQPARPTGRRLKLAIARKREFDSCHRRTSSASSALPAGINGLVAAAASLLQRLAASSRRWRHQLRRRRRPAAGRHRRGGSGILLGHSHAKNLGSIPAAWGRLGEHRSVAQRDGVTLQVELLRTGGGNQRRFRPPPAGPARSSLADPLTQPASPDQQFRGLWASVSPRWCRHISQASRGWPSLPSYPAGRLTNLHAVGQLSGSNCAVGSTGLREEAAFPLAQPHLARQP